MGGKVGMATSHGLVSSGQAPVGKILSVLSVLFYCFLKVHSLLELVNAGLTFFVDPGILHRFSLCSFALVGFTNSY